MTTPPVHLRACLQMVAAEVTRRTLARVCAIIRLVTSAATMPGAFLKHALTLRIHSKDWSCACARERTCRGEITVALKSSTLLLV